MIMSLLGKNSGQELRFWEIMAIAAYSVGLTAIGVFAASQKSLLVFGVLWIVGTAAWLAGSAIGFLFGVPRVRTEETTESIASEHTTMQTMENRAGDGAESPSTKIVPNTNL